MKKYNSYKNVKKYIDEHGIKQKYIAEKLGTYPMAISNILNGKGSLTADKLVDLAILLESDPNSLLDFEKLKKKG